MAERILACKTITMAEVQRGQDYLQSYCQLMLRLGAHLTINHHISMHYVDVYRRFGPVYVWWLFAFERINGDLEKVNVNGGDGGEMELTLLRNWVLRHRCYELVFYSSYCFEQQLIYYD